MGLTKEDIEKYGTGDEKKFLKESDWQHPEDKVTWSPRGSILSSQAKQAFRSDIVQKELTKWCDNNDQENTFHRGFFIGYMMGAAEVK